MKNRFVKILLLAISAIFSNYVFSNNNYQKNELYIDFYNYMENRKIYDSFFQYLKITDKQAQGIEKITIDCYISDSLPITNKQFPNLRELVLVNTCEIKNLKGIADFEKLEIFRQVGNVFPKHSKYGSRDDCSCYSFLGHFTATEIWKCKNLRVLEINSPTFVSDSITNLEKLETLYICTYDLNTSVLSKNKKLKSIKVAYSINTYKYNVDYLIDFYLMSLKLGNKCNIREMDRNDFDFIYFNANYNFGEYKPIMDGQVIIRYNNGNIAVEGNLKDGKPENKWTYFFKTGDTAVIREYKNGKIERIVNYCESSYFFDNKSLYFKSLNDFLYIIIPVYKLKFTNGNIVNESYYNVKNIKNNNSTRLLYLY